MSSTLIPNSQASVEAYEDMFKEITRKLYGEEASQSLHAPPHITSTTTVSDAERSFTTLLSDRNSTSTDFENHGVGVDNVNSLKSDDHLTAFGLALMQNGFPTPNAILNSQTFHQINKQNQSNAPASNNLNTFSANMNAIQGQNNTSNEVTNPWISKCETYPYSQKQFKAKKQEVRENTMMLHSPVKSANDMNTNNSVQKRYNCTSCTYSSDRRDLFTRHENIHKEDKPFHCYVCLKQFNRADHVKKHFLRMHRGLNYDICRTKRTLPEQKSKKSNSSATSSYNHQMEVPSQASIIIDQTNQHLNNTFHENAGTSSNHQNLSQQSNVKVEKTNERTTIRDKRFMCCYCSWSGNDNWGLKRHLNTHTKPFVCVLCDYKAARSERLATHVLKVHNKKICTKCNFMAENQNDYNSHVNEVHANETRSQRSSQVINSSDLESANNILRNVNNSFSVSNSFNAGQSEISSQTINNWRSISASANSPSITKTNGNNSQNQKQGAERLFQYFEADDSDPEDYARQLQMAAISRNTAAVAQDFHNAGGGNRVIEKNPIFKLHTNVKYFEQKLNNEFLNSIDIKMKGQGSMIGQYISPPANQMNDKENKSDSYKYFDLMPYIILFFIFYFLLSSDIRESLFEIIKRNNNLKYHCTKISIQQEIFFFLFSYHFHKLLLRKLSFKYELEKIMFFIHTKNDLNGTNYGLTTYIFHI